MARILFATQVVIARRSLLQSSSCTL